MNVLIDTTRLTKIADKIFRLNRTPKTPTEMATGVSSFSMEDSLYKLGSVLKRINNTTPVSVSIGSQSPGSSTNADIQSLNIVNNSRNAIIKAVNSSAYLPSNSLVISYVANIYFRDSVKPQAYIFNSADVLNVTDNTAKKHIYTNATSRPSTWNANFNLIPGTGESITVHYGVSEDEFLEIVSGYNYTEATS